MAKVWADRVKETTATTGTGTLTLAGAQDQHQAFSVIGTGNICDYCLLSGNGTDWETGIGTVTVSGSPAVTTLSRDTVYASSSGGAKINLSGASTVFLTVPAARLVQTAGAIVRRAAAQAISSATDTAVSWDTEDRDDAAFYNGGSPTRLTVPYTGWYTISASTRWSTSAAGDTRFLWFRKNGSFYPAAPAGAGGTTIEGDASLNATLVTHLTATDYIEIYIWQATGGPLNLNNAYCAILFNGP